MADTYKTLSFGSEVSKGTGGVGSAASAVATLVADGASPTQAHVTAHNTAFQALVGNAAAASVLVNVDTTIVSTVSLLRAAFTNILAQAAASGMSP